MNSNNSDDLFEEKAFDWNKYLLVRNAEEVPEDFFHHVCESESNGISVGSVVEVENEDQSGYWFASVCSSKGVLINLHYFGDDSDKHDFWLEVKSSRIHSLNWGSDNNKKLLPPYPDRFSRVNPKTIKEKVEDCENIVPNSLLKMNGAPIYNILKPEMFVEVQDKEYPYRVWISKILKNVGGRLFLEMQGISSPEKKPFWLFYLNERIFPLGWAEHKGLPWRVMNLDTKIEDTLDSSFLLNVLKPKTPEQHSYKVGEMLEVINPYSLMVFYVATIVKIYDNRYFKVEVDNDNDTEKRITFIATKENPYLFNGGWANKHKFLLKPPSDWKTLNTFCWFKYLSMKGSKLANIDNVSRKNTDHLHVGMKLEAVDPMKTDHIRIATVKGFADHWMVLSFDRTRWRHELLHVRSVYSDDIFPVGWCNKHKYLLNTPKLPFTDCDDYEKMYYASDIDCNLSDNDNLEKYPDLVKGEIFYHYSKKNDQHVGDELKESIQNILNEDCVNNSNISKSVKENLNNVKSNKNIEVEEHHELDEELHDAILQENENHITVVKDDKYHDTILQEKNVVKEADLPKKKKISEMCIYFNKNCYFGRHIVRKKVLNLPNVIGPGPISVVLQNGITLLLNCDFYPGNALNKIKNIENMLFNGPGGIKMLITTKGAKYYSQYLLLPTSKSLAQLYCSAICNIIGICGNVMSTEQIKCSHCKEEKMYLNYKPKTKVCPKKKLATKPKAKSYVSSNSDSSQNNLTLNEEINPVGSKSKFKINTDPSSINVTRKRYFTSINSDFSQNEKILQMGTNSNLKLDKTETKLSSMNINKKKTKPSAFFYSDHLPMNEKKNTTFVDSIEGEKSPRKIMKKRRRSTFIGCTDQTFTLNKEMGRLEVERSSMNTTVKIAKYTDSTDLDFSANYSTFNKETSGFALEAERSSIARKRAKYTASTDLDCSANQFERHSTLDKKITENELKSNLEKARRNHVIEAFSNYDNRVSIIQQITKVAVDVLDWSNSPLVERYYYYLGCIINYEAHMIRLNESHSELEIAIISEIQLKKSCLSILNEIDSCSNTKSDIVNNTNTVSDTERTDEKNIAYNEWRLTFENFYRHDIRFKKYKIDIGHFEPIKVTSNPKYWSPADVFKYLSSDLYCLNISKKLYAEEFDGVAFMILNEEQLLKHLNCKINLAIRIMCHVIEVKYICLTKYSNI